MNQLFSEPLDLNWKYTFHDDDDPNLSAEEQKRVEDRVIKEWNKFKKSESQLTLFRDKHIKYLTKGLLDPLSSGWQSMDASRPWLCYWIVHALDLLGVLHNYPAIIEGVPHFLKACQSKTGGFGGGPDQLAHLAPTYAAVNALVICGTTEAYNVIDRKGLYNFLMSTKNPVTGEFVMHVDGEDDVRGCYCALSAASLTRIITPELTQGVPEWIGRCQTYEGGMGGYPGNEAHGGYTFCAFAAAILAGNTEYVNIDRLLYWATQRQMSFEGGFQGRTNKLVDSCYSFWQAGTFPLIDLVFEERKQKASNSNNQPTNTADILYTNSEDWLFRQRALQEYILVCCQDPEGGLKDKPGKTRDFYHTCYALSGLSIAQHNKSSVNVVGVAENLIEATHPLYNIRPKKVTAAFDYFNSVQ